MIEVIKSILKEVNSFYYSINIEKNTIEISNDTNPSFFRELLFITRKLDILQIKYNVTRSYNIQLHCQLKGFRALKHPTHSNLT